MWWRFFFEEKQLRPPQIVNRSCFLSGETSFEKILASRARTARPPKIYLASDVFE